MVPVIPAKSLAEELVKLSFVVWNPIAVPRVHDPFSVSISRRANRLGLFRSGFEIHAVDDVGRPASQSLIPLLMLLLRGLHSKECQLNVGQLCVLHGFASEDAEREAQQKRYA